MDIDMLIHNLPKDHWERVKGLSDSDFKSFRLTRHLDKKDGSFLYLAQAIEGDDDIYQLVISDTSGRDPLKEVQIVQLQVKDKTTIVGILGEGNEGVVKKN